MSVNTVPSAQRRVDGAGKAGDGGGLEEVAQGELDAEGAAQTGEDLNGKERVAAEGEEVVVDGDAVAATQTPLGASHARYAMPYESDLPLTWCRTRLPLATLWPTLKHYD
jgi:hypothetical protein